MTSLTLAAFSILPLMFAAAACSTQKAESPRTFKHNFAAGSISYPGKGAFKHPHLLCDADDIKSLRARIQSGRSRLLWNRLLANCRLYSDPKSEYFVDFEGRKGDFGRTGPGYTLVLRAAGELALAGHVGGMEEFGRRAAKILHTLARPDVREDTFCARGAGKGGMSSEVTRQPSLLRDWSLPYDLAEPFMTDPEKQVIREFLLERLDFTWSRRWVIPAGKDNRALGWSMGPAMTALALWGDVEHPLLARYPGYSLSNVEDFLDSAFYPDGTPLEGAAYGTFLGQALLLGRVASRKEIAHGLFDQRPLFKNAVLFYFLTREPDNRPFAFSKVMQVHGETVTPDPQDSGRTGHDFMIADPMWQLIADAFDAPMARWWWRRCFDAQLKDGAYPFVPGDRLPLLLLNLLFCNDVAEDVGPEELRLPASYHFKKRGVVVARRDHHEETPVFRMVAGPVRAPGQVPQHWDALSISLSAYGQRLIVDPGYYLTGSKGAVGSALLQHTEAHSAPLVNGRGQETLSTTGWPATIIWHERQDELEYVLASAAENTKWIRTDGYGPDCRVAERHALVVHEATTPFYVVISDIFEYSEKVAAANPELQFVLVGSEDTNIALDQTGATFKGPKAQLRVDVVTREGAQGSLQSIRGATGSNRGEYSVGASPWWFAGGNPRVIWSRKGKRGRFLTVLTPLKSGTERPEVSLLAETDEKQTVSVKFGDSEDRITFWAPRPEIMDGKVLKTGMRMKVVRSVSGKQAKLFTVPPLPGGYVVE